MNKETLKALKASIRHWENVANHSDPITQSIGRKDCALCDLFNTPDHRVENICRGCPVADSIEMIGCRGTPYMAAARARTRFINASPLDEDIKEKASKEFKHAAEREAAFLKGLLPQKESKQ